MRTLGLNHHVATGVAALHGGAVLPSFAAKAFTSGGEEFAGQSLGEGGKYFPHGAEFSG